MARLIHLTDIHFGCEDVAALEAATAFVHDQVPDLVVVTGDLTRDGRPAEFEAAARWLNGLPGPQVVTPGNHDTPYLNLPLRALVPFDRYRRWIGPTDGCGCDLAEVSVRAVNTARGGQPRPDWSKGAINLAAADAAAQALAEGPTGALRVIACHHPLIEAIGAPVTGGVHRGHLAAERLATQGVDLILTGHVHNPFAVPLPFGDALTYAVGAGTLSTRLRGVPPSFNVLTIEPEGVLVQAMAWNRSHFEPLRTWELPRRTHP
ncbi:MAG TPA: metallophosphoesterase [Caulobacteraceae bacterium]|jgi:3',5'-cyclic AMP phosphodiesterase CpdA|nr:metallophosphoesterase [Caulobacteraceae bacterium]